MKKTIYLILTSLLLVTGCYKEEYEQIDIEMKDLVDAKINPLEAQIAKINESLGSLNPLSEELKDYIASLERASEVLQGDIAQVNEAILALKSSLSDKNDASKGEILAKLENAKAYLELQLSNVDSTVQALRNKYDSLSKQTEDLETLVADQYATREWIDATFVTLDAQQEVIADVETVKKLISTLDETSLKIESDLKSFIDEKIKETLKEYEAGIAEMVVNIADDYTRAIAKVVEDLKKAYTPELSSAISELETSIMTWVSEALDDYYTVAAAEAQVEAFKAIIGNVPAGSSLQGQIDDLTGDIEFVKAELLDAYSEAISSAITESEGKLKDALDEIILGIRNGELKNLTEKVSSLRSDVEKLIESLDALRNRINTLDEQVFAIKNTLKVLSDLNITLKEYVSRVEEYMKGRNATEAAILKELLDDLKNAVNGPDNDASLQSLISKLKSYVGTIPTGDTDIVAWVQNSIATMNKAFDTYASLDYVSGLKDEIDNIIKDHSSRLKNISDRLGTAIDDSRETVDSWITEILGDYCTKTEVQGKLESFETTLKDLISGGDAALEGQISSLSETVGKTIEELKTAFGTAIFEAINNFNGYVTSSITGALENTLTKLDELDEQSTDIEESIEGILNDIQSLNERIGTLQEGVSELKAFIANSGYDSLKEIVNAIANEIEALSGKYASLEKFNEINGLVTGQNGYTAEIEKLKKMADDLKTAEETIINFNELAKDFDLGSDNLKSIIDAIKKDLETLKTSVFGSGTKPGLRDQLNAINEAIDKINDRIEKLNADILKKLRDITSISYDSQGTNNGKVILDYDGKSNYTGNLYYDVRPKAIASTVASIASIQYISTPVRSSLNLKEADAKITGNNETGEITANVSIDADDVNDGVSVALFAGDFSSEFVGIYTTKKTDERMYCNPSNLYFKDGISGTQNVKLHFSTSIILAYVQISAPSWIKVTAVGSTTTEGGMYVQEYRIDVTANTDSASREGEVKFTIPRVFTDISTTLYVTQVGRETQTIEEFYPASGSLKFTWDGKVIDEEGEISSAGTADITVITSDGGTDWEVESSSDWANVVKRSGNDANKARLSIRNNQNNTTGVDREGTLVFTPVGGEPVEYKFTQLKRDKTDISVTIGGQPVEKIILNYNGTGYKTSDDATEWKEFNYGNRLLMTVTTEDKSTDWSVSEDPTSDWITAAKSSQYLSLSNITANGSETDRSLAVVISNSAGEIGRIPVTQLCRKLTTVTTADPHYMFSYDAKKYRDYTVEPENWTSISNNRIDIPISTGDGSEDWTVVSSNPEWLSVEKRSNGSLRLTAGVSNSPEPREATVTFSCGDYQIEGQEMVWIVKQQAVPDQTFTFNPELNFPDYKAGSIISTVTAEPDVEWTVSLADPNNGWLTVERVMEDRGRRANPRYVETNQIKLEAETPNDEGEARTSKIRITYGDGLYIDYDVTQPSRGGISIKNISPWPIIISENGRQYSTDGINFRSLSGYNNNRYIDVNIELENISASEWKCSLKDGSDWASVSKPNSNRNTFRITITGGENTGAEERSATISFTYNNNEFATETFTQVRRSSQTLQFNPTLDNLTFDYNGHSQNITVTPNDGKADWSFEQTSGTEWLNVTRNGNAITLSMDKNNSGQERTSNIVFKTWEGDEGAKYSATVTQNPAPTNVTLSFDPVDAVSFDSFRAGEKSITVTPDPSYYSDWTVEKLGANHDWLVVEKTSTGVKLTATSNNTSSTDDRTVALKFTSPGNEYEFNVTQPKFVLSMTVNPTTIYFSGDGTRYKTAESGSWSGTNTQGGQRYVPASVTMTDDSDNWDINSSSWSAGATKEGKTLRINPKEDLSPDSWSSEKPSGIVTVTSTADARISEEISIVQNRPMTISSSSANNTATVTVKSDSDVTISWDSNLTVTVNGTTPSGSTRQTNLGTGDNLVFTVKRRMNSNWNNNITIRNAEGSSKSYTVSNDGTLN